MEIKMLKIQVKPQNPKTPKPHESCKRSLFRFNGIRLLQYLGLRTDKSIFLAEKADVDSKKFSN